MIVGRREDIGREYLMYINGERVSATSGKTFDDYNPFTGEVLARVASGRRRAEYAATSQENSNI